MVMENRGHLTGLKNNSGLDILFLAQPGKFWAPGWSENPRIGVRIYISATQQGILKGNITY